MAIGMGLAVGVVVLAAIAFALYYNSFVGKRNSADLAFSTIDVLLKKRYDLIPNLVASVKQYMTHESETFTKVAELRTRAMAAPSADEAVALNNQLGAALRGLMVQVERYPELKANENFLQLQRSLNEMEEQLSAARRSYNASVTEWNNAVQMFPGNLFAGLFGFARRALLETPEAERANPDVGGLFKA